MSTKNQVYKLEKELAFWREVHKYEPMSEPEFKLESQILQLSNPDEFGTPRYDGHIKDEDDDDYYDYPTNIMCKYCKNYGFKWVNIDGKWRLVSIISNEVHRCKSNA